MALDGIAALLTLALVLPTLGALYCALLGDVAPRRACGVIASLAVGAAAVCAFLAFQQLNARGADQRFVDVTLYTWINAGGSAAGFGFMFDPLSATMMLVVTGVGFLIHVYATAYMLEDMHGYRRFFCYMNLFIVAMLILVLANNFLMLMIGWGGVGLASYLLIAFYFDDKKSDGQPWPAEELSPSKSGMKAFVTNMIGDVGLMLAVALMFARFGSVSYDTVFKGIKSAPAGEATAIALLLLVAAIAKSGQFPLHVWLPDAMTGPTPVSALIHAATMVTAGVYLVARAHPIYEAAPSVALLVAVIGAGTALFAATIGLVQPNLKRVLAYSTVSQLGYMFMAVGIGAYSAGIFHLVTHAFFKACLFLAAGSVIHALHGEENMEHMGGLRRSMPLTYWSFLFGALALAGFPLTAGFVSKDEILAAALEPKAAPILGFIGLVTAALTAFYTFRAFFRTFHGEARWHHGAHPHEAPLTMAGPVLILALLALVGGLLNAPAATFEHYIEPVFRRYVTPHEAGHAVDHLQVAILSGVIAIIAILAAAAMYARRTAAPNQLAAALPGVYDLLRNRCYVDQLYSAYLVAPLGALGRFFASAVDRETIDGVVESIGANIRAWSVAIKPMESGYLRGYALAVLIGVVIILFFALGSGRLG